MTMIREYVPSDKAGCLAAFKSNVPLFFTEGEIAEFESFLDKLGARSADADGWRTWFFVVESGNQIVGCGGFGDKDNSNRITLAWGLVHKDFHKKGFGEQLLKYRLGEIKKRFPEKPVFIDTTQFSYPFFEKFGFRTTKITDDFYAVGMHRYDMVLPGE
ncbi:MAG TPA: GNAT family N-acetyltransferase [Bacteroidia bacterium]|nr:GNAT family N-acetyltransferase [Bacteroidia bacterium]